MMPSWAWRCLAQPVCEVELQQERPRALCHPARQVCTLRSGTSTFHTGSLPTLRRLVSLWCSCLRASVSRSLAATSFSRRSAQFRASSRNCLACLPRKSADVCRAAGQVQPSCTQLLFDVTLYNPGSSATHNSPGLVHPSLLWPPCPCAALHLAL